MTILQNLFFRAILVPILLTIAAALLETAANLAKGRSIGQYKYRIWARQKQADGSDTLVSLRNLSLETILESYRTTVVNIEQMVSFDVAEYGSLGIELMIGAFAVDIVSLINASCDPTITGYILIGHLLSLIGVVLFVMLNHLASPEEQSSKRIRALISISLGMSAMMIAFFAA
jgi:hypothetical protein